LSQDGSIGPPHFIQAHARQVEIEIEGNVATKPLEEKDEF